MPRGWPRDTCGQWVLGSTRHKGAATPGTRPGEQREDRTGGENWTTIKMNLILTFETAFCMHIIHFMCNSQFKLAIKARLEPTLPATNLLPNCCYKNIVLPVVVYKDLYCVNSSVTLSVCYVMCEVYINFVIKLHDLFGTWHVASSQGLPFFMQQAEAKFWKYHGA